MSAASGARPSSRGLGRPHRRYRFATAVHVARLNRSRSRSGPRRGRARPRPRIQRRCSPAASVCSSAAKVPDLHEVVWPGPRSVLQAG